VFMTPPHHRRTGIHVVSDWIMLTLDHSISIMFSCCSSTKQIICTVQDRTNSMHIYNDHNVFSVILTCLYWTQHGLHDTVQYRQVFFKFECCIWKPYMY